MMKTIKLTRMGIAALCAVLIGLTSCETRPHDSTEVAKAQNEVTFDNKDAEDDANHLAEAARMLQKNVRWGELAASKATSKEVKGLGTTMAMAHSADLAGLRSLATARSISLPAAPMDNTMEATDDLNDKKGWDFDREYCDKVVSSHKDAIAHMEALEGNARDPEIRAWATKILMNLRTHLISAEALYEIVKDKR